MLPKVVLGSDESLALSQAQKLLVIIYYSGPQFMLDQLQSPVCDCFSDVFSNQGHIICYILNENLSWYYFYVHQLIGGNGPLISCNVARHLYCDKIITLVLLSIQRSHT